MSLTIRVLQTDDLPTLLRINVDGDPGVGQVTKSELADLLSLSVLPLGAFDADELVGFVICLLPKTRYASLNYAWFNERYDHFLYVDRIAIAKTHRNRKIGSLLYDHIIQNAEQRGWPIAAEVNLQPPNPGSMRFHRRYGFDEVGALKHKNYTVAMVVRNPTKPQTDKRAALLCKLFELAPMKHTFGMDLSYDGDGNALFEMPYKAELCHAMKDTHGGVIATLLDNAGWFTAALQYDHWVNTSELTVRLHEPANQEDLRAIGKIVRAGKRMCVASMEVRSVSGRLIATGSGTFVVSSKPINLADR